MEWGRGRRQGSERVKYMYEEEDQNKNDDEDEDSKKLTTKVISRQGLGRDETEYVNEDRGNKRMRKMTRKIKEDKSVNLDDYKNKMRTRIWTC